MRCVVLFQIEFLFFFIQTDTFLNSMNYANMFNGNMFLRFFIECFGFVPSRWVAACERVILILLIFFSNSLSLVSCYSHTKDIRRSGNKFAETSRLMKEKIETFWNERWTPRVGCLLRIVTIFRIISSRFSDF